MNIIHKLTHLPLQGIRPSLSMGHAPKRPVQQLSANVLPIDRCNSSLHKQRKDGFTHTDCKGVVGILTKTFRGSYYGRMIQRISDFMQANGYLAFVQSCDSGEEEMERWLHLQACQCDGLILHADTPSDETLSGILDRYPATILMNRYIQPFQERCVYLDNKIGGMLAANYLLEQGHRSLAMVTGPTKLCEVRERSAGFLLAIDDMPSVHCTLLLESDFSNEGGAAAMEAIIHSNEVVSAIFFQNDDMAHGALSYCHKAGISIPGEYSLVGYDDLVSSNYTYPPLTSIHQPLEDIGDAAARMLHKLLSSEAEKTLSPTENPHGTYFIPRVTERDSVARIKPESKETCLSDREIECLTWTAKGKTSWEISVILGIAECTVSFHLRNVGKKLSANNRTHSVALGLQSGLIEI